MIIDNNCICSILDKEKEKEMNKLLLSSDTLTWYWLDFVFETAKNLNFDGIDLAMRKNFDSWNSQYVVKLQNDHGINICSIQVSENANIKELNQAVDLANKTWCDVITINSPKFFNISSYRFLDNNIEKFRENYPKIKFSIINPPKESFFALPIPKFHFTNIIDIIKNYKCFLGLDISNMDTYELENIFIKKIKDFAPYVSNIYLSDKNTQGKNHLVLWDWNIKIWSILKEFFEYKYQWYFSIKISLEKKDLADMEKVNILLSRCKKYFDDNYNNKKY